MICQENVWKQLMKIEHHASIYQVNSFERVLLSFLKFFRSQTSTSRIFYVQRKCFCNGKFFASLCLNAWHMRFQFLIFSFTEEKFNISKRTYSDFEKSNEKKTSTFWTHAVMSVNSFLSTRVWGQNANIVSLLSSCCLMISVLNTRKKYSIQYESAKFSFNFRLWKISFKISKYKFQSWN